jgi:hypothetical protein
VIRLWRVLAGLLATVWVSLALAACSNATSLTTAEYRSKVQQVCRDLRRRTDALPRPEPTATTQLVRVGRRALALQRDALGRIQSLDAPSGDERTIGRWLDLVDTTLDAGAASLTAQAGGDLAAARSANARGNEATLRADALARSLGVAACTTPVTG